MHDDGVRRHGSIGAGGWGDENRVHENEILSCATTSPQHPKYMQASRPQEDKAPTSASAPRIVSKAKRARLNDKRTSDLTLLSHEKELSKAINIDKIIDNFSETNCKVALN